MAMMAAMVTRRLTAPLMKACCTALSRAVADYRQGYGQEFELTDGLTIETIFDRS
jgi:hypothetical protein